jgi:hypothetical protein
MPTRKVDPMKARARVLGALGALALAGTATFAVAAPAGAQNDGREPFACEVAPCNRGLHLGTGLVDMVTNNVSVKLEYTWQRFSDRFGDRTVPISGAGRFCQTTAAALLADLAGDGVATCDPRAHFDAAVFSTS